MKFIALLGTAFAVYLAVFASNMAIGLAPVLILCVALGIAVFLLWKTAYRNLDTRRYPPVK